MKVVIYTDFAPLFGRLCNSWQNLLMAEGHQVDFVPLGCSDSDPIPLIEDVDLNFWVAGMFVLKRLAKVGLPRNAKNLLWMLDPLAEEGDSEGHRHKAVALDVFGNQFDTIIAMNSLIADYANRHYPNVRTYIVPITVDPIHIIAPMPDATRSLDVLHLGHRSERRQNLEKQFTEKAKFSYRFVWGGLWDEAREPVLTGSRISLKTHLDSHVYFDQFRSFEAWAAGNALISEPSGPTEEYGVEPGVHHIVCQMDAFVDTCDEILRDAGKRSQMIAAGQELLRTRYVPAVWKDKMLEILHLTVD